MAAIWRVLHMWALIRTSLEWCGGRGLCRPRVRGIVAAAYRMALAQTQARAQAQLAGTHTQINTCGWRRIVSLCVATRTRMRHSLV